MILNASLNWITRHTLLVSIIGTLLLSNAESHATDLIVTRDTKLDPNQTYGRIIIKASNVTLDGRGAWLIGPEEDSSSEFKQTAITANGVSSVTLKNINAKGWETGLHVTRGSGWTIEGCDFSDNFHDPEYGWGGERAARWHVA